MSCGEQFATGFTKVITRVQERRFPVMDEERWLVLSVIRFDHSGKNKTITWADGGSHPSESTVRSAVLLFHRGAVQDRGRQDQSD
jgi:hypothetical protein